MKRFVLFILVVLFIGSFLGGCNIINGTAYSQAERENRFKSTSNIYARQFIDDCDSAALYDRPSYASEWPIRDTD